MFESHLRNVTALLVLSGVLFFWLLGGHGLFEPDEGRYSEIPREMIESGDYLTPRLNGVLYFEKPILHYWLTASAFKTMGQNEFASRFWPALMGTAGVLSTYFLGATLYGKKCGILAGTVLASSLLYWAVGELNITDMPLSAFIALSMTGFILAMTGNRRWLLLFYAAMGAAVLTKGLIGIVLPGGAILFYILWTRRWSIVRESIYIPGIILFTIVTVPWFWAVCRENPDFFHFFFIKEHFLRYTTKIHHRYEPFWFFIPVVMLATVPWTGFLPAAIYEGAKRTDRNKNYGPLLVSWFGFAFLFFSASDSKLVPYIVPALPPLAILISSRAVSMLEGHDIKGLKRAIIWTAPFTILLGSAFIVYPFVQKELPKDIMIGQLAHKGIILLAGTCLAWLCVSKRRLERCIICLALTGVIWTGSFKTAFSLYDRINSARDMAMTIKPLIEKDDVVAQYGEYLQGITFYLGRRNVLVDYEGELAFGASKERDPRWFIGMDGLIRLWNGERRVFLIAKTGDYESRLDEALKPNYVLGTDWEGDNVIISNRNIEEAEK